MSQSRREIWNFCAPPCASPYALLSPSGYPDYILKAPELDKKYEDLNFNEDEYFNNNVELSRYNLKTNLKKLDEPVNKTKYVTNPKLVTCSSLVHSGGQVTLLLSSPGGA